MNNLKIRIRTKKAPLFQAGLSFKSGWQDSNLRPPGPKPGAMTGLRYIPNRLRGANSFSGAVRAGFEPAVQLPVRMFRKHVLSASQAALLAIPFLKRCANVETKSALTKLF